ncbi:MAG TPA: hypothetical protein VGW77_04990, partial [Candidatus Binatia bacterium]|nr:hypothetical protein [Candidatus Binatia bacterium]
GLLPNNNSPTRDTTVAASGDSSLKFVVPSNSSAPGGGDYFANFSTDLKTRFGANQSFFIQWRQRFNSDFLNTGYWGQFLVTDGGTLTFSATSGNGVTATIAGGSVTFTGWEGRAISDSNLVAYANIVSVTDATHAVVNITGTLPSTTFTSGNWLHTFGNAGGWKQLIVGGGDVPGSSCSSSSTNDCTSTCTSNDIVVQNTNQATYPQTYSICNYFIPHVISFNNPNFGGSGDFKEQTARTDPFCTYLQRNAGTPYANRNCFRYVADEWMTFQLGVDLGAEGTGCEVGRCDGGYPAYVDSRIRLWVARDGQPSELVMDTIFDVDAGDQLNRSQVCCIVDSKKIGKVILLPYHTGKAGAQVHPEGDIWYDELIISTQQIADPTATGGGGSPGDTTPPMINITSPTTNPTYSTSSSSIDISGTASDNVGVTSVTWSCDVCGSGSATGTTSWSITGITLQSGVNVITVTAGDAAANTGSDTLTVTYTPPPSSISIKLSGSTTKKIGAGVTEKVGKQ